MENKKSMNTIDQNPNKTQMGGTMGKIGTTNM